MEEEKIRRLLLDSSFPFIKTSDSMVKGKINVMAISNKNGQEPSML